MTRTAVVVFNLGGPDSPEAVRPFLRNLFSDPMILRVPAPVRRFLAWFIAWRRAPIARDIYEKIGGRSPILQETERQADAVQHALGENGSSRVFVAMRYWHPFAHETARAVADWAPDRVVLLPLYPQYSTTTTESFVRVWTQAARAAGIDVPTGTVCCWPEAPGFVDAMAREIGEAIARIPDGAPFRLLLSAHGLPQKIVDAGDPYAHQIERTAAAVIARLGRDDLDWRVCYQSRVGPLEWLKPYTEAEIRSAGDEGLSLVVAPVAFVSEHSETLVELDIEYARLAEESGVPYYVRVPTVNDDAAFVSTLADLVRAAPENGTAPGGAPCADGFAACPCRARRA